MSNLAHWSVIINLRTCRKREWARWESRLTQHGISYSLHFTHSISELSSLLSGLLEAEERHFLFAGGDGSLHHGGNLLLQHAGTLAHTLVIGVLPCGSGNDWVRTFTPADIMVSIKSYKIKPLHTLHLEWPDGSSRFAFNMVGGALDAAVVDNLQSGNYRWAGSLKYGLGLIKTLYNHHTWKANIFVDGKAHSGKWLSLQAGFGKYCGGGMLVLPHAKQEEPALLLMKPKSLFNILISLPALYTGKIIFKKGAIALHFTSIIINDPIPLEADGEWLGYGPVRITVRMNVMRRLE